MSGRWQSAHSLLDRPGGWSRFTSLRPCSLKPPVGRGRSDLPMGSSAGPRRSVEDESAWVERAQAGDQEAFRMLVERHRDRAYGLALRIVRSPADAEDVAQEAFSRAWRALPRFRGESAFGTWLHRIVARRALDRAVALRGRLQRETSLEAAPDLAARAGSVALAAPRPERRKPERLLAGLS